jgi:hypothetical protein
MPISEPSVSSVRRANLGLLASRFNFDAQLAKAVQLSRSLLSQYQARSEDGVPRKRMGERVARRIESNLGLPTGWMDHPRDSVPELSIAGPALLKPPAGASVPKDTELKAMSLEGLSAVQVATLTMAARLARQGALSDQECVALLASWHDKMGA